MNSIKALSIATALVAITGLGIGATIVSKPEPAQAQTACGYREAYASFETRDYWVYICGNRRRLFYLGQEKYSGNSFRLPVYQNAANDFVAYNGGVVHSINPNRLRVTRNGRTIVNQRVIRTYYGGGEQVGQRYECNSQVAPYRDRYNLSQWEAQRLERLRDGNLFIYRCYPR